MAKLSYPTSRTIECPLLIEVAHLESLDKLVDGHIPQMRQYKDRRASEEAAERARDWVLRGHLNEGDRANFEVKLRDDILKSYDYQESRSVSLYLTKGREIQAQQFSEATSQPVDEDEMAVGFSLRLRVGPIHATVKAGEHSFHWSKNLSVDVEPNDNEIAQGLFGALSNWASDVEAPKWQQKWSEHKWRAGVVLTIWLIVGVFAVPLYNWNRAAQGAAKQEAHKLLATGGVNSKNEQQALELLLTIESGYSPAGVPASTLGLKYWGYISLGVMVLVAIAIYPDLCIGIWKGKRRLRAWRVWMRTLAIGIPSSIGLRLLLPWILYWLNLGPPGH